MSKVYYLDKRKPGQAVRVTNEANFINLTENYGLPLIRVNEIKPAKVDKIEVKGEPQPIIVSAKSGGRTKKTPKTNK